MGMEKTMADPANKTCTENTWVKIATNVTAGQVHKQKKVADTTGKTLKYLQTYVMTGGAAPVGTEIGVPMFDETAHETISASAGIDPYVYCMGGDGLVRVDV
jgi:hypothetical protein